MEYPDLSYAKILAVDDSPTILCTVKALLKKYNISVFGVLSGMNAIKMINQGKPIFNAVFMDYLMPEMDGIETVAGIRALNTEYAQKLPIIAITAVGDEKFFLNNGFQGYLQKPLTTITLRAIVERWIEKGN